MQSKILLIVALIAMSLPAFASGSIVDLSVSPFGMLLMLAMFFGFTAVGMKFYFNPIRETTKKREDYVTHLESEVSRMTKEMEQLRLDYEAKMTAIRSEITSKQNASRQEASKHADTVIDAARQEVASSLSKARQELQRDAERVKQDLEANVSKLAGELVKKLVS